MPNKSSASHRKKIAAAALAIAFSLSCLPPDAWAQGDEAAVLEPISVIGARHKVRSVTDTAVPIDIIDSEELTNQGASDISNALRALIPSYNVSAQPISDEATFVRPVSMRGLGSDQMLVFVNGKRRHRSAVITFLGNGVSDGSQGPDVSVIPAIALKRVEVLRDSASAQYGSDAIAGVLNFVLKDRPEGGVVEAQWGQTYEGDGAEYRTAANVGFPVTKKGFVNVSAEWRQADPTVRSVQRDNAAALIKGPNPGEGNPDVEQPFAQIWGNPDVSKDLKTFVNFGLDVDEKTTAYAFANYATREAEEGYFFRNPNTRVGVYVQEGGKKRLFLPDLDTLIPSSSTTLGKLYKDTNATTYETELIKAAANCATGIGKARVSENEYFDRADADVVDEKGCYSFNERYPGGFRPKFTGDITDVAGTVGFRGSLASGMTYDFGYTHGQSEIDFFLRDTVNASLGEESPNQFYLGTYTQTEQTMNIDFADTFDIPGAAPLHAAFGFEWREEEFKITEGEKKSWEKGPYTALGAGVGTNGFSGFSPKVAGQWSRTNVAMYTDFEMDVTKDWTLALMGRWEDFEDFAATTDFKLASLYQADKDFALRGSISSGFRVPTIGQENLLKIQTQIDDVTKLLSQVGVLPVTCVEAINKGAKELEPEQSLTFSGGVVVDAKDVSMTVDYFNIKVDDRIGLSADKKIIKGDDCLSANPDVKTFKFLGNGFDTRTQGVDIIVKIDVSEPLSRSFQFLANGKTELVLAANWTETEITSYDTELDDDDKTVGSFIDAGRLIQLEQALPKTRFNLTLSHDQGKWKGYTRLNYFGAYTETHLDASDLLIEAGSEVTLDVEVTRAVTDALELSAGAENIFNNFPDLNPYAGIAGAKYPESSPMGLSGGFYYARVRYSF